jgi:hypothetical protein
MWSSWLDTEDALQELDEIAAALESGALLPAHQIGVVFAPTGPMHELAVSSGWSAAFGQIAAEVDAALAVAATRTEFPCSLCERVAGTAWLESDAQAARESVGGRMWMAITREQRRALQAALKTGDPAALFAVDLELAPFWCPKCAASYCGEHWVRWSVFDDDGWHDSIRGRCPHGHERMLED